MRTWSPEEFHFNLRKTEEPNKNSELYFDIPDSRTQGEVIQYSLNPSILK